MRAGVSFLPYDCGSYQQMPYESIDRQQYEQLAATMPAALDWRKLAALERLSNGDKDRCEFELACSAAGGCEMVDVM